MALPLAAAVQLEFFHADSATVLETQLLRAMQPALECGVHLIVLPQHTGLTWREHGCTAAGYMKVCAGIAARHGIWLLPGSTLEKSGDHRVVQATLLSPDGHIAGCQQQTHLGAWEHINGVTPGDSLQVLETPCGRVGIVIGEDIRYPEVSRILVLQGAEILLHLAGTPAPFREEAWLAALWREVQANQVFGITACLVGDYADRRFAGRSALLAPVEMTEGGTGILAQAHTTDAGEVVMAALDLHAVQVVKADYDITRYFNHGLYARELPAQYRQRE